MGASEDAGARRWQGGQALQAVPISAQGVPSKSCPQPEREQGVAHEGDMVRAASK